MKKNITTIVLTVICSLALTFGLTACGDSNGDTSTERLIYTLNSDNESYSVTGVNISADAVMATDTNIVIPPEYNGKPVTGIGDHAFNHCERLKSITIPSSVTSIGSGAFTWNDLEEIKYTGDISGWCGISGLRNIMKSGSDTKLYIDGKEVTGELVIPTCVTSIADGAFYGCSSLMSITIPDSVTSIGGEAFSKCRCLTIYCEAASKPSGWDSYWCSSPVVWDCKNNDKDESGYAYSVIDGVRYILIANPFIDVRVEVIKQPKNISGSITVQSSVTYKGTSYSVMSIVRDAFDGCSNLTSITIPNSVTRIGSGAFNDCTGLTSITIPNSVTSIEQWAFSGCSSLAEIRYTGDIKSWCAIRGLGNLMSYGKSDRKLYINNTEITGDLVIPDGVTSIGSDAFNGCTGLTSITIPNSVTSIGYSAFSGCSGLTSIEIPNSVTSIGSGAFNGCTGLTSITIPNSVTSIESAAFLDCSKLIQKENGVSYVDKWVIDCDIGVASVSLRSDTVGIAAFAFLECRNLTSITFSGTKAGWNAISKGSYWDDSTGNYTVICNDGKLDKDGNEIN